jgi:Barstar (barnase inhibitor)
MDRLCDRLCEVHEAGVYRLNCTVDEVRTAAQQAGFELFDVDCSEAHSKGALLAALAQAITAPEWFGNNWDALGDALCDLSWRPAPGYVLILRDVNLAVAEEVMLNGILLEAASFWEAQGKAFWAFFA